MFTCEKNYFGCQCQIITYNEVDVPFIILFGFCFDTVIQAGFCSGSSGSGWF